MLPVPTVLLSSTVSIWSFESICNLWGIIVDVGVLPGLSVPNILWQVFSHPSGILLFSLSWIRGIIFFI
jgi:hypothetical protein